MAQPEPSDPPIEQPPANAERGEDTLELEGVPYRLRPSFEANVAIEKQTGHSLIELYNRGLGGALSLDHLGIIATNWIKAGAEDDATRHVGAGRISELIYEEGQVAISVKLTAVLQEAITGGRKSSGEAKAVNE